MDTRARSPSPSHGAPNPSPSLSPVTTPVPATTSSLGASCSLSPDARPFLLSGRSKAQRWEDPSPEDSSGPRPSSYHEALLSWPVVEVCTARHAAAPATAPHPKLLSVVGHCTMQAPTVDGDGWRLAESYRSHRHHRHQACPPHQEVPHDLRGRCFNYFSLLHRATTCHRRTRCFRCREPGHHVACCPHQLAVSRLER
jgi:hypothetical protein